MTQNQPEERGLPTGDTGVGRYPSEADFYGLHSEEPQQRYRRPDMDIYAKIRGILCGDETLDARGVRLAVIEGQVYVRGQVESTYSRNAIQKLLSDVPGVLGVKNELQVLPDSSKGAQWTGSEGIRGRLSRAERSEIDRY